MSEELKHTPKPWQWGKRDDGTKWISLGTPFGMQYFQADAPDGISDADLTLMVMSPDLKDGVKFIVNNIIDGEGHNFSEDDWNPDYTIDFQITVKEFRWLQAMLIKAKGGQS